jgi:hypothetical protein
MASLQSGLTTNEFTLRHVCAFVDAQGFSRGNEFFVRELAFKSSNLDEVVEFSEGVNSGFLKQARRKTFEYQIKNIHGIDLASGNLPRHYEKLPSVLQVFHRMLSTKERPYFACKNQQLAKVLTENKIPFVDLSIGDLIAPSLSQLDFINKAEELYFCYIHDDKIIEENKFKKLRCARRKVRHLWKYYQDFMA